MLRLIFKKNIIKTFVKKQCITWDIDLNQKVKDAIFVVLDTETTGLDLKKDEVISIGAYKIKNLELNFTDFFHVYFKVDLEKAEESIKVHGITFEEIKKRGVEVKEGIKKFLEFIKGSILVGYFLEFDLEMIKKLILKERKSKLLVYALDVIDLYPQRDVQTLPKLEELLDRYNLPKTLFHNALEDAYMTALLFLRLVYSFKDKKLKALPLKFL